MHVAIVGARQAKNIENRLGAADLESTAEDLAEIERIPAPAVQVGVSLRKVWRDRP